MNSLLNRPWFAILAMLLCGMTIIITLALARYLEYQESREKNQRNFLAWKQSIDRRREQAKIYLATLNRYHKEAH